MADEADIILDERVVAQKQQDNAEMEIKVKTKKQKLDKVSSNAPTSLLRARKLNITIFRSSKSSQGTCF